MPGSGREPQAIQYSAGMQDYRAIASPKADKDAAHRAYLCRKHLKEILERRAALIEKIPRRSFLGKTIRTASSLLLAAYIGITAGMTAACKSPHGPDDSKSYTLTLVNRNLVDDNQIGGNVIVEYGNGKKVSTGSGGTVTVNSNRINSIKVDAPGYYAAYVLSKEGPGVVCSLDANGAHGFNMSKERMSIDNFVIPQDIDIIQFAKCIGNGVGNDTGDGTVQRFDHSDRRVKVGTLAYPDKPTAQTIEYGRRAAQIINEAADGTLFLDYIGEVSSSIDNGCTHAVDNHSKVHGGVNVSNNAYEKSVFYTPNVDNRVSLATVLEEMMNSSTGLRWDAGGGNPYIMGPPGPSYITDEGKKCMIIVNKMPLGFKFSTTGIPTVDLSYQEPEGIINQELGPDQNPHNNHMLRMPGEHIYKQPGEEGSNNRHPVNRREKD